MVSGRRGGSEGTSRPQAGLGPFLSFDSRGMSRRWSLGLCEVRLINEAKSYTCVLLLEFSLSSKKEKTICLQLSKDKTLVSKATFSS
jgi:hypothetical protein